MILVWVLAILAVAETLSNVVSTGDVDVRTLTLGRSVRDSVTHGLWQYYKVVAVSTSELEFTIDASSGDPDVFLRVGGVPSFSHYDQYDVSFNDHVTISVQSPTVGTEYYVGIYGASRATSAYTVVAENSGCPNGCSGHGTCDGSVLPAQCHCQSGWGGADCSSQVQSLREGVAHSGSVDRGEWTYYALTVGRGFDELVVVVNTTGAGDVDLFVRHGDLPSFANYDALNMGVDPNFAVRVDSPYLGEYYLGLYGYSTGSTSFLVTYRTTNVCPSMCSDHGTCEGAGCSCYDGFSDPQCGTMNAALQPDQVEYGFVDDSVWNYYYFMVNTVENAIVQVNQTWARERPDCDVFVRRGLHPTRVHYDVADVLFDDNITVVVEDPGEDTWYIGVYGYQACHYNIKVSVPSYCEGGCGHGRCIAGTDECECDTGYVGARCDHTAVPLNPGAVVSGAVAGPNSPETQFDQWAYYNISTSAAHVAIYVREASNDAGDAWLFVAEKEAPTSTRYDFEDASLSNVHSVEFNTGVAAGQSTWYIVGVYASPGSIGTSFQIEYFENNI